MNGSKAVGPLCRCWSLLAAARLPLLAAAGHRSSAAARRTLRARRAAPFSLSIKFLMRTFSKSLAALGLTLALTVAGSLTAQNAPLPGRQATGPVIQSEGMSFKVDNPTFDVPAGHVFKAVWIISTGGGDSVKVNQQLVTIARFYNAHARNGFSEDRLKTAAVFHGDGWTALLNDSAFVARFGGKGNPSKVLVQELLQHGAQLVLCGQTAGSRGIHREELLPGVKVAVSAMAAFNVLQAQGYQYNPW